MLVKRSHPDAVLPSKKRDSDAGLDLTMIGASISMKPGEVYKISTGISVSLPKNTVGLIWPRSGLGSKGIHVHAGVIDQEYVGEIIVCLSCIKPISLFSGDRIAQLVIQKVEKVNLVEVDVLENSSRGEKGFGSSGS